MSPNVIDHLAHLLFNARRWGSSSRRRSGRGSPRTVPVTALSQWRASIGDCRVDNTSKTRKIDLKLAGGDAYLVRPQRTSGNRNLKTIILVEGNAFTLPGAFKVAVKNATEIAKHSGAQVIIMPTLFVPEATKGELFKTLRDDMQKILEHDQLYRDPYQTHAIGYCSGANLLFDYLARQCTPDECPFTSVNLISMLANLSDTSLKTLRKTCEVHSERSLDRQTRQPSEKTVTHAFLQFTTFILNLKGEKDETTLISPSNITPEQAQHLGSNCHLWLPIYDIATREMEEALKKSRPLNSSPGVHVHRVPGDHGAWWKNSELRKMVADSIAGTQGVPSQINSMPS